MRVAQRSLETNSPNNLVTLVTARPSGMSVSVTFTRSVRENLGYTLCLRLRDLSDRKEPRLRQNILHVTEVDATFP